MNCPTCDKSDSRVLETRCYDGETVMRRRSCTCGTRWSTKEKIVGPPRVGTPTPTTTTGSTAVSHGHHTDTPPATHPQNTGETGTLFPESDPISFLGSPEPSKPNQRERELDGPKALAVVKPAKPSAFTVALEQFKAAWGARYGVDYCETSVDRSHLGRLIQGKTPQQLAALPGCFAVYLNDLSPFVAQERRHDLTWFCTGGNGFNKYRTTTPVISRSEAQTFAAGEQWETMNGKG